MTTVTVLCFVKKKKMIQSVGCVAKKHSDYFNVVEHNRTSNPVELLNRQLILNYTFKRNTVKGL